MNSTGPQCLCGDLICLSLASLSTNLFVESGSKHPQMGRTANSVFPDAPTLHTEQFQSFLLEQLMRRKLFTKAANTEMPNGSCSVRICCYVIFTWFYFSLFLKHMKMVIAKIYLTACFIVWFRSRVGKGCLLENHHHPGSGGPRCR